MRLTRKTWLGAAALGVTVLTTGAVLAHGWGGPGKHGGPREMLLIETFDTNGDGKVTQIEIDTARKERLTRFDKDGNGELNLEEYAALWADAMRQSMVRQFQANDRDGNASVTVAEFAVRYQDVVSGLDRNGDGELSRDELRPRGHGPRRGPGEPPPPDAPPPPDGPN